MRVGTLTPSPEIEAAPESLAGDGVDRKAALASLINLSGKQRMLSHRTVMFLSLSRQATTADAHARLSASATGALGEFAANRRALVAGDLALALPPLFSRRVARLLHDGETAYLALIDHFLDQAQECVRLINGGAEVEGRLVALADLVAGDLLAALNRIAGAFEADLAQAIEDEKGRSDQARRMATTTLEEIRAIGLRVKLIAFNALIEAARAGDSGRSFAVIANEIKALSEQTQAETSRVSNALADLFGDRPAGVPQTDPQGRS